MDRFQLTAGIEVRCFTFVNEHKLNLPFGMASLPAAVQSSDFDGSDFFPIARRASDSFGSIRRVDRKSRDSTRSSGFRCLEKLFFRNFPRLDPLRALENNMDSD